MPRQANAVDFWRGFALVSIFINHVPGIWYERLTHRNVSISDSAELFVFLAGWSLGLLVRARPELVSAGRLVARLGARALTIYAAQILICSLALAILAATAYLLDNPLILEWKVTSPTLMFVSSSTSRRTAWAMSSPGSMKPARVEYILSP